MAAKPEHYFNRFDYLDDSENHRKNDSSWLIIYLDVFTLILSMFIILLGFKMTTTISIEQITRSVSQASVDHQTKQDKHSEEKQNRQLKAEKVNHSNDTDQEKGKILNAAGQERIRIKLNSLLNTLQVLDEVQIQVSESKIRLDIADKVLFRLGSADLSERGEDILVALLPLLNETVGEIHIEGHTDSLPIANEQFPSNWELSSHRASRVVRLLIEEGINASNLRVVGFADTKPRADNRTEHGRSKNRRVSITIYQ